MVLFVLAAALLIAEPLGLAEGVAFRILSAIAGVAGLLLRIAHDVLGDYTVGEALRRLALVLAAIVVVLLSLWALRPRPLATVRLAGDVNIGLTAFSVQDDRSQSAGDVALGKTFSEGVADELERLRSPEMTGTGLRLETAVVTDAPHLQISNTTLEELETWALAVAEESNSQFLLSGSIRISETGTEISTGIFVNPSRVPDAPELSGWYKVSEPFLTGRSIDSDGNLEARGELRVALSSALVTLLELASALESLDIRDYSTAIERFEALLKKDSEGKYAIVPEHLVHLFLGNAHGRAACLDSTPCQPEGLSLAERSYDRALELDRGSLRARVGLAEVALQRAQGNCSSNMPPDIADLATARRMYQKARTAASASGIVWAKASLGISRIDACLVSAAIGDDDSEVVSVAADLEALVKTDPTIPPRIVAEAHSLRGLTAYQLGRPCEAIEGYDTALDYVQDADRRALWEELRSAVASEAQECDVEVTGRV